MCATQGFSRTHPASRIYPLVCAETRPLFTSQLLGQQPESGCNPTVASHQSSLVLIMQVMKGGQIQASGLYHPVGWPRSHIAVVTKGYVPVVCESEAQRLAPVMILQINIIMCGGQTRHCPKGCRAHRAGSYETSPASIVGLDAHRFRPGVGSFLWQCRLCPYITDLRPITLQPHVRQRLAPIVMLQISITMCGGSGASLPELPRHSDPAGTGRMHKCTTNGNRTLVAWQ